ncbi:MAG: DUF1800 domain-containing protein [Acidobacteriota bacterium]|nr:MAG: DUF1800 domain-containing protein [Acidobacteriota bacterium]
MRCSNRTPTTVLIAVLAVGLAVERAAAQAPGEVTGVSIDSSSTLSWDADPAADDYSVYRGLVSELQRGIGPRCHGDEITELAFISPADPSAGEAYLFLVTAESDAGGEGSPGTSSTGQARATLGSCDLVMRNHLFARSGYCWGEWTADRFAALGAEGYLNEQLDPSSVNDVSNSTLQLRLNGIDPPEDVSEIVAQAVVRGMYARRQLEQQTTMFWVNHFNTNYEEIRPYFNNRGIYTNAEIDQLTVETQYREMQEFRDLAFNGTFREIVEASGLGPAMILYLDNDQNVANRPNENYARELLELHTMGVDRGYTQKDVEEMARIWSGWNVCKKTLGGASDPLAACLPKALEKDQPGKYVANFRVNEHDCGEKILFEGTAYETIIDSTCSDPPLGVEDVYTALDAVADHPSTPEFISRKLIEWFVTEQPTQEMIDTVVAAWNNPANPRGVGDLREVLRAIVGLELFDSPDSVGEKIKTPLEHIICSLRATRGLTNGINGVQTYLQRLDHRPHRNPVPTGYPELGDDWLDTGNLLERQKWGRDLTQRTAFNYGTGLTNLMADNGLDATSPAGEIIEFWAEILFGGALTPAEKQEAIDYLTTDDEGNPSSPDDTRIRETVGFMMGYPQFLEQ